MISNNGNANEEFNNIFSQNNNRIRIKSRQFSEISIFLDGEFTSPADYRDEIHTIINSSEVDSITLVINSPGGQLSSALAIVEAIKHTDATVTAVIMGDCSSAATIVALNCPSVVVLDSAEFMIHTAKFGSWGTTNNVKDHVDFNQKQINKLIDETYAGFLTKQEIEQVKIGVEYWFDSEQIRERMDNRIKYLKRLESKKSKKANKEEVLENQAVEVV